MSRELVGDITTVLWLAMFAGFFIAWTRQQRKRAAMSEEQLAAYESKMRRRERIGKWICIPLLIFGLWAALRLA